MARALPHQLAYFPHIIKPGADIPAHWCTNSHISRTSLVHLRTKCAHGQHNPAPTRIIPAHYQARRGHSRTLAHQLAYFPHQSRASSHKVRTWPAQSRTNSHNSRTLSSQARTFPHIGAPTRIFPAPVTHIFAQSSNLARTSPHQLAYFPHQASTGTDISVPKSRWHGHFRTERDIGTDIPAPSATLARTLCEEWSNIRPGNTEKVT
jgi:hypothetical protein